MKFSGLSDRVLGELGSILRCVDEEAVESLVERILSSDRIFLAGMGRSGLVTRPFAMRLMQLGLQAYVVGDATTPAIGEGDLLTVVSSSGETRITHHIASAAKGFGARVFLLTGRAASSIGRVSDLVIVLPDAPRPVLPLRSAFEGAVYIFLDAVIVLIMERTGVTCQQMMERHSNLE